MGCFKIGAEVCNNCVHWQCHAKRTLTQTEVQTTSNCDKCSLSGRNTISDKTCAAFSHIGGVSKTFAYVPEPSVGELYCQSLLEDLVRKSDALRAEQKECSRNACQKKRGDFFAEADRKFARTMEEREKANKRIAELLKEGLDPSCITDKIVEFMHLYDKANSGEGEYQFALAQAFWNGTHGALKEDESSGHGKGWRWCNESADNGYCWAQLWKGISWRNDAAQSNSIENHKKAIKWLEKALQHAEVREKDRENDGDYSRALNSSRISLGVKYLKGKGVTPDFDTALSYFKAVEESGDSRGADYKKKAAELRDKLQDCIRRIKDAAEYGLGDAYNELGMIYAGYSEWRHYQLIVKVDCGTAVECFQKAADNWSRDGMDNLGNCYKNGDGVEKNIAKAVEWYRKSADLNWPAGLYHYATCLWEGDGVEKDEKEALRLFMKAGAQGNCKSLCKLGHCAKDGCGMDEDPGLAFTWFKLAAEAGDAESMHNLGLCYESGYGCEEDKSLAEEWNKKADDNGYSSGW